MVYESRTLQELIAPGDLTFYNSSRERIGSKKELLASVESVTNIAKAALTGFNAEDWSVAQRMSWAASRTSTRLEDIAYSLLGIFDVNMPLLYGEGSKAFIRLQQEILASAIDISIFAWNAAEIHKFNGELLAPHPSNFALCKNTIAIDLEFRGQAMEEEVSLLSPIAISNIGIDIEVMLSPWRMNTFLAYIARHNDFTSTQHDLCFMILERVGNGDLVKRCCIESQVTWRPTRPERKAIHGFEKRRLLIAFRDYKQTTVSFNGMQITSSDGLLGCSSSTAPFQHIWSNGTWQGNKIRLGQGNQSYGTVAVAIVNMGSMVIVVLLGFDRDYNPMCLLFEEDAKKYQMIVTRDAKTLHPQLVDSRWTWKRWDGTDRVHRHSTYNWVDLGSGTIVYKSIDRQGFSTENHPYVNVRFYKKNATWAADISRQGVRAAQALEDTNNIVGVLNVYRRSLQKRWQEDSRRPF